MADSCNQHPLGLLLMVADLLQQRFDQAASEINLTTPQAQLLVQLEQPIRMGDVAQARLRDPSTLTTSVARMERDGYVRRVVDPADGRARLIELTPKGLCARHRLIARIGDGGDVIAALPGDQRAALAQLFTD